MSINSDLSFKVNEQDGMDRQQEAPFQERSATGKESRGMLKSSAAYLGDYYRGLGDGNRKLGGLETGFPRLDRALLGLNGVAVLGGIAGSGKSSLALQIAYHACTCGTPVLFYSLEMPRWAIYTKILSRLAGVPFHDILLKGRPCLAEGYVDVERLRKLGLDQSSEPLVAAKKELEALAPRLYVITHEDRPPIDLAQTGIDIEAIKRNHGTKSVLVVVDHMQVFPVKEYENQIDKEIQLIKGFKELNGQTGATFLLVSQLNKEAYKEDGIQTLKGAVDIIYLADVVMIIRKKNQQDEELPEMDHSGGGVPAPLRRIDLAILKNRYNACCKVCLDFEGMFSKFSERQSGVVIREK